MVSIFSRFSINTLVFSIAIFFSQGEAYSEDVNLSGSKRACSKALSKAAFLSIGSVSDLEMYFSIFGPAAVDRTLELNLPIAVLLALPAYQVYRTMAKPRLRKDAPKEFPIAETSRGVLNYSIQLGLLRYDYANKTVLDVGSGYSRFTQFVNLIYGATGTVAIAMDKNIKSPGKNSLKADATDIPFKNDEFDLVVSNFAYMYFDGSTLGANWLSEMIRVTKPGGQLRLRVASSAENKKNTDQFLEQNKKVEKFSYQSNFGLLQKESHLTIELK